MRSAARIDVLLALLVLSWATLLVLRFIGPENDWAHALGFTVFLITIFCGIDLARIMRRPH